MAQYHEGFWIAVATIGPVLALAYALSLERAFTWAVDSISATGGAPREFNVREWMVNAMRRDYGDDAAQSATRSRARPRPRPTPPEKVRLGWRTVVRLPVAALLMLVPYVLAGVGFVLTSFSTSVALDSLAANSDHGGLGTARLYVAISFSLLLLQVPVSWYSTKVLVWRDTDKS